VKIDIVDVVVIQLITLVKQCIVREKKERKFGWKQFGRKKLGRTIERKLNGAMDVSLELRAIMLSSVFLVCSSYAKAAMFVRTCSN
jgi:hypothetical protein